MKTAIFLGAGASSEDGAPLQSEVFNKYFAGLRRDGYPRGEDEERAMIKYFRQMFGIDVTACDSSTVFPTFEEAMGILDLAVIRDEVYKGFTNQEIRFLREYLVKLMTYVIGDELGEHSQEPEQLNDLNQPDEFNKHNDPNKSKKSDELNESQKEKLNEFPKNKKPKVSKHHRQLVRNLIMKDKLKETVFVSTNYDILIDNALALHSQEFDLDYGIDFVNVTDRITDNSKGKKRLQSEQSVKLYKFHGSLNWLYCPACNTIELTPFEEAAARSTSCYLCGSEFSTLIVPPTYFKSMANVYLGMVWIKAELALREAQNIIFCGYSFTDVDMHIKYLIKRVQNYREKELLFTVINNYNGKTDESKEAEKNRFQRFLGKRVDYTDICFGEFASDPLSYWK